MSRKYPLIVLVLALLLGCLPTLARADGDPPPPRPTTIPYQPPPITGVNTAAVEPEGHQGDFTPSGIPGGDQPLPLSAPGPPPLLDLPALPGSSSGASDRGYLDGVPSQGGLSGQIPTDTAASKSSTADTACGPRALSAALRRLDTDSEGSTPTADQLLRSLGEHGLLYPWGTGAPELAYIARQEGYAGTYAFEGWTLDQLADQLSDGRPVVVPLGLNGPDQPGHFVAVTGISEDGGWVWVEDPDRGTRALPRDAFQALWESQGSAGLVPLREPLPAASDPFLPWMGLFSALSLLIVAAGKKHGLGEWENLARGLRNALVDPRRKGIGGGIDLPHDPDLIRIPIYEDKKVLAGWRTVTQKIPQYAWKKVRTGTREVTQTVPVYQDKRFRVGTRTVTRQVPRYVTRRVQSGWRQVRKRVPVTRYRRKVITRWKKVVRRVPVYRRFGWTRIKVGTQKQVRWKRVQRVRRVPYTAWKTVTRRVPVYKDIRVRDGTRTVHEQVPVYEWRKVQTGVREVTKSVPVYQDKRVRVGTQTVERQVPVYHTRRVHTGWKQVPLAGPGDEDEAPPVPHTTVEYLKSQDKASPEPRPTTTVEYLKARDEIYDGTSPQIAAKISADYLKSMGGQPASSTPAQQTWLEWILEKYEDSEEWVQRKKKQALDKINEYLEWVNLPSFLSLSAGKTWDFNLFQQEGVVSSTYVPPNILSIIYMEQVLDISSREKITANPGAFLDIDLSSGNGSIQLLKRIKYCFGPNRYGISIRTDNDDQDLGFNYKQDKYLFRFNKRGLTYIYKLEIIDIDEENSRENFNIKTIGTINCKTRTIKYEGILVLAAAVFLAWEFGLLAGGTGAYSILERALSGAR